MSPAEKIRNANANENENANGSENRKASENVNSQANKNANENTNETRASFSLTIMSLIHSTDYRIIIIIIIVIIIRGVHSMLITMQVASLRKQGGSGKRYGDFKRRWER